MVESNEVMTIQEAAKYLKLSPDTIYKYASERRIPAFKFGNRWRFRKSALDAWMLKQETLMMEDRGE